MKKPRISLRFYSKRVSNFVRNFIFYCYNLKVANNMKEMGMFIENLQKNFCFLFVFCSVLLQEGKVKHPTEK